jgi:triacylglycerol lipase
MGGLMARYAVQRLGMADKTRAFITLATPHQGTYAAQYANTEQTISLRPNSKLIEDLNKDDLSSLAFYSFGSDRDIYVIPHSSMNHKDADNRFIPNLSHSQFLVSPVVFRQVLACLDEQ